jgi:HEAT repeat protein
MKHAITMILILLCTSSAVARVNVAPSIEWLVDQSDAVGVFEVTEIRIASEPQKHDPKTGQYGRWGEAEITVELRSTKKGEPPKKLKSTYMLHPTDSDDDIAKEIAKGHRLLFFFRENHNQAKSNAYRVVNLDSPAVHGPHALFAADFTILWTRKTVLAAIDQRLKVRRANAQKNVKDRDYWVEVPGQSEAHGSLYGRSKCYLIMPRDLWPVTRRHEPSGFPSHASSKEPVGPRSGRAVSRAKITKSDLSGVYPAVWFNPGNGRFVLVIKKPSAPPKEGDFVWLEPRDPEIKFSPTVVIIASAELTLKEFVKQINSVPGEKRKLKDPLTAIQDKSAAVRYFAIYMLGPSKSKEQEQALVDALEDDVRWLRHAAAVKLGMAGLHAERVAPILVEALGNDNSFHLWGTRNIIRTLYKIGAPALPHLTIAIDHPNELLRENGCFVLGQLPHLVKDRKRFQKPMAALDAAIAGNKYPTSRPMYVFARMKINGDEAHAEKLLREDARSKSVEVRVAALRQIVDFDAAAKRFVPLLIEVLDDDDPKVVRAATATLGEYHRNLFLDVSAAAPAIARQLTKQREYYFHTFSMRFLLQTGIAKHCPIEPLIAALSNKTWAARAGAARMLGAMGAAGKSALPGLRELLNDSDKSVREAAQDAIEAINSAEPK